MKKILIADDDPMLLRLLEDIIRKNEYQPISAQNGEEAIGKFFDHQDIDLCILDVMMPIYSGYEVLEAIREYSDVPVIMLTALGQEVNEIKGLNKGANDYVAKPFSYAVLLARIENLLRLGERTQEVLWQREHITVDFKGHRVWIDHQEIQLNKKEFSLLEMLIHNEYQVLMREQLLDKIWGYDYDGDIRTVDTHIKMLRKKLGEYGNYILTIRGVGYVLQVDL